MITKISTAQELKQIFLEIFLNKTDKVNDISNESVLSGIGYGVAKIGQKCLTNQAIIEGHIFPDSSYGSYLDEAAKRRGVSERFTASGSSTYIRLVADKGTYYSSADNQFLSTSGVRFSLEKDVTIGIQGFEYAKVKSESTGMQTNVGPVSINRMTIIPQGHISCTNEYQATGGSDFESDETYRVRIKESVNQLARDTVSYIEQILMKINNNVLRVLKGGVDGSGKLNLTIVPCNGQDFTSDEINEMVSRSEEYLSINEFLNSSDASTFSLQLNNVKWFLLDVQFRLDIDPSSDIDVVRKDLQIQMSKLFDYRFWKDGNKIEWENLLFIAKNTGGVRYVPDTNFLPRFDINVPIGQLPRIRGFVIRDLDGNLIYDNAGILSSFYYPNEPDYYFQQSVLATI